MRCALRRGVVRALVAWSIPASYMLTTRVVEVAKYGTDVTYLIP